MSIQKLDILAVGVHPDDVELGCGGTLIKHQKRGSRIGILDLTRGELGTRGSASIRDEESKKAARIMNVDIRKNLAFRDGFFTNDEKHQIEVIKILRKYNPNIVLANAWDDRHPDHSRAAKLVYDACFLSGLPKVETFLNDNRQDAFRPQSLFHYIQSKYIKPSFVVDISDYMDLKMKAIKAYSSQFYNPKSKEKNTFISSPRFMSFVLSRAAELGNPLQIDYAEGFIANRLIGVNWLSDII